MHTDPSVEDQVILSYDASNASNSRRVQVSQVVHGRRRVDANGDVRKDPGFVGRPGVVRVGQSVLILRQADADELADRLRRLGAWVAMAKVSVDPALLPRFQAATP
jgi:hypothetical protein